MKIFILVLIASFGYTNFFSQTQYVYSPDSSVLSVLFKEAKVDVKNKKFTFSLKNNFFLKLKNDSIKIDIRGQMVDKTTLDVKPASFKYNISGKVNTFNVTKSSSNFYTLTVSKKTFKKSPYVIISWLKGNPKNTILFLDGIDIITK